jgi:indolepyruvate ferredoxin oxidoreductase beta subunit
MDEREIYSMPVLIGQAEYPHDADQVLTACVETVAVIPASRIAEKLGNIKVQNLCLLGALVRLLGLTDVNWDALIAQSVPPKMTQINQIAFQQGYDLMNAKKE